VIGVPSRTSDLARSSPRTRSVHEAGRWSWSWPGAFSFKIGAGRNVNPSGLGPACRGEAGSRRDARKSDRGLHALQRPAIPIAPLHLSPNRPAGAASDHCPWLSQSRQALLEEDRVGVLALTLALAAEVDIVRPRLNTSAVRLGLSLPGV